VTNWQNTLQGHYLRSWYPTNKIKPGDRFVVEVTNLDCSTVTSTQLQSCGGSIVRPRQVDNLLASGSETAVRRTLDNRTNVVVAPFGDLQGGVFEARGRLSDGRVSTAQLVDSDGDGLGELTDLTNIYSEDGLVMKWGLDGYVGGIGFIGETASANINLTWELVEHSSETTQPPSSESTSARQSGSYGWDTLRSTSLFLVISIWAFCLATASF
jgi:hypothetical protein